MVTQTQNQRYHSAPFRCARRAARWAAWGPRARGPSNRRAPFPTRANRGARSSPARGARHACRIDGFTRSKVREQRKWKRLKARISRSTWKDSAGCAGGNGARKARSGSNAPCRCSASAPTAGLAASSRGPFRRRAPSPTRASHGAQCSAAHTQHTHTHTRVHAHARRHRRA